MRRDRESEKQNKPDVVSISRIFVPYFCAGLVINMFLRGRLDVDPILILVLAAGLALGIYPLPDWFYPDKSIVLIRSRIYILSAIFLGCAVASICFPPFSFLAFVSTMVLCPLAFYAGYVGMQLRDE